MGFVKTEKRLKLALDKICIFKIQYLAYVTNHQYLITKADVSGGAEDFKQKGLCLYQ